MRQDCSPTELALLQSGVYTPYLRAFFADGDGAWQDMTTLAGVWWLDDVVLDVDLDNKIAAAQIMLRRDAGPALSLSPLRADSTVNRNAVSAFVSLVDAGRDVYAQVGVGVPGSTEPLAWHTVFVGSVDTVDFAGPIVTVSCRDELAVMADRFTSVAQTFDYSGSPRALATAIQERIDAGLGVDAPTLWVPEDPNYALNYDTVAVEPVLDQVVRLAQLPGWDFRSVWDDAVGAFRPALLRPGRSTMLPVVTFAPNQYISVQECAIDRTNVRNQILISYGPADHVTRTTPLEETDAASISRYGMKTLHFKESSEAKAPINTENEARMMAQVALEDLREPAASLSVELFPFWPAELNDYCRFTGNGVHFDTDTDLAVTKIRHRFGGRKPRTQLWLRGRPAAYYRGWIKRAKLAAIGHQGQLGAGFTHTTTRLVAATDTHSTWELAAIGPDGSHGEVKVREVSGSATLVTGGAEGRAIDTYYPSPEQFTFLRGDANGPDGGAAVRGVVDEIADDDSFVIPAQGRDTVPLTIVALPGEQTDLDTLVDLSVRDAIPQLGSYIRTTVYFKGSSDITVVSTGALVPNGGTLPLLAHGEALELLIPKPPNGRPAMRVTFESEVDPGSGAASRVRDSDSVDISPQQHANATVQVGSVVAGYDSVALEGLTFSAQTARVDVYVREYDGDPGAAVSVESTGYQPAGSPLDPVTATTITIPLGYVEGYLLITLVARDVNGSIGTGTEAGTGVSAGRVTIKAQGTAVVPTAPDAPTALSAAPTGNTIALTVTMPASVSVPAAIATLRVYRDGALAFSVARTAGDGGTQVLYDTGRTPGATHTYSVRAATAGGILSAPSPSATATADVPTEVPRPTTELGSWDPTTQTFPIYIYRAPGTPAETVWVIEDNEVAYGQAADPLGWNAVFESGGSATTVVHYHAPTPLADRTDWIRVTGTKTGYDDSVPSKERSITIPAGEPL